MSDKQRELFEMWAVDNGYAMNKITADCYTNMFTQIAWDAWQAAIASVVVELPSDDGGEMHAGAVCAALDDAGIKYK